MAKIWWTNPNTLYFSDFAPIFQKSLDVTRGEECVQMVRRKKKLRIKAYLLAHIGLHIYILIHTPLQNNPNITIYNGSYRLVLPNLSHQDIYRKHLF